MANTNSYQNNTNEVYSPTTKCGFKFYNDTSTIDKTTMSFKYWNKLLAITLNQITLKEGSAPKVETENHIDIYLSPMKANTLLNLINGFRANPDKYDNVGVNTNKGVIYLVNGAKVFGLEEGTMVLVIEHINTDGVKESEAAYEFHNVEYGMANFKNSNNFSKITEFTTNMELDMFCKVLSSYVDSSTYALAASIAENNKYVSDRYYNFMKDVRTKLGIENRSSRGGNGNYNTSNWFNNNSSTIASAATINANTESYDDIVNDINSMME